MRLKTINKELTVKETKRIFNICAKKIRRLKNEYRIAPRRGKNYF